jgi:hypothetical protein
MSKTTDEVDWAKAQTEFKEIYEKAKALPVKTWVFTTQAVNDRILATLQVTKRKISDDALFAIAVILGDEKEGQWTIENTLNNLKIAQEVMWKDLFQEEKGGDSIEK